MTILFNTVGQLPWCFWKKTMKEERKNLGRGVSKFLPFLDPFSTPRSSIKYLTIISDERELLEKSLKIKDLLAARFLLIKHLSAPSPLSFQG